jgi:NitT/TauT family transport system substrate-binding protein
MVPGPYLDENRETVVKYLRGWSKGIVFMNANPRAAAEIAIEYAPENLGEIPVEDVQAAFVDALLLKGLAPYFDPGSDVYQKVGMQDLQGWEDYMNYLIEAGSDSDEGVRLDEPVDLSTVVTNDLIDDINDFDYAAIEDEAANHPSA